MSDDTDEYNPDIQSYRDYHERITMMADMVEERLEDDPCEEVHELVFTEVDSSRMAMMTHESINALKHSNANPDDYLTFVDITDQPSWTEVVSAMAFVAVREDLYEELRRRDVV